MSLQANLPLAPHLLFIACCLKHGLIMVFSGISQMGKNVELSVDMHVCHLSIFSNEVSVQNVYLLLLASTHSFCSKFVGIGLKFSKTS